ncbi:MAG: hypothetical protein KBS70_07775 [Bacteroidales bacterium]|nr:hypothetical protein [Candidatus Colicola equi]
MELQVRKEVHAIVFNGKNAKEIAEYAGWKPENAEELYKQIEETGTMTISDSKGFNFFVEVGCVVVFSAPLANGCKSVNVFSKEVFNAIFEEVKVYD